MASHSELGNQLAMSQDNNNMTTPAESFAIGAVSGGIGGCASTLFSHPLDLVKVRLQSDGITSIGNYAKYRNGYDCVKKIASTEGVRGFFKGILPPFVMQGFLNLVAFSVERAMADHVFTGYENQTMKHFMTGMVAGFSQSFLCAPIELVKTHMQHRQIGSYSKYTGNFQTMLEIIRNRGVRGPFQGLCVTMFRDAPGFAVYFAIYEGLLDWTARRQRVGRDEVHLGLRLVYGGSAGVISFAINYPVELVKTRFQLDGAYGTERQFRSSTECFLSAWREGGYRLLYRGLNACLLWAMVCNVFLLPTVDVVEMYLKTI